MSITVQLYFLQEEKNYRTKFISWKSSQEKDEWLLLRRPVFTVSREIFRYTCFY